MEAKYEKQTEARRLRQEGYTIPEIEKNIGCNRSSISLWVKNVIVLKEVKQLMQIREQERRLEGHQRRKKVKLDHTEEQYRRDKFLNKITIKYEPKKIGEASEAIILAALIKAGKTVLLPFGNNQRYDLVIDENGKFIRVQVKTGKLKDGSINFPACSSRNNCRKEMRDYRGEVELFGIYCPDLDKIYFVPVEDVGIRTGLLRVDEVGDGKEERCHWAKDYEFC